MPFYFFVWDDETEDYLQQHSVSSDDFEAIVCDPDALDKSRSTGRPLAFGWSGDGRYLCCVYEYVDDDTSLPITAFEVD